MSTLKTSLERITPETSSPGTASPGTASPGTSSLGTPSPGTPSPSESGQTNCDGAQKLMKVYCLILWITKA